MYSPRGKAKNNLYKKQIYENNLHDTSQHKID